MAKRGTRKAVSGSGPATVAPILAFPRTSAGAGGSGGAVPPELAAAADLAAQAAGGATGSATAADDAGPMSGAWAVVRPFLAPLVVLVALWLWTPLGFWWSLLIAAALYLALRWFASRSAG